MKRFNKSKKGLSNVVVSALLVSIAIAAAATIGVFIFSIQQEIIFSPEVSCSEFNSNPSLKIDKACYINSSEKKEVMVRVSRSVDNFNFNALRFNFYSNSSGEDFIYEITGKKCSDVKTLNNQEGKYGEYCDILKRGHKKSYVFNFSDIDSSLILERVFLGVYLSSSNSKNKDNVCSVESLDVEEEC